MATVFTQHKPDPKWYASIIQYDNGDWAADPKPLDDVVHYPPSGGYGTAGFTIPGLRTMMAREITTQAKALVDTYAPADYQRDWLNILAQQTSGTDFDNAQAMMNWVNSVNAYRLEGQKTIMYRVLEALAWQAPDWIVVPGGNLGNSSAFGKAFMELKHLGLIDRIPRLAIINATGSNTLNQLYERGVRWNGGRGSPEIVDAFYRDMDAAHARASTIASAIEINRPVNLQKCLRALEVCDGVVREVSDQEILDAKAMVGVGGLGCEPASAASVAGARLLSKQGVIAPSDRVACILTGHPLKDPNVPVAYHSGDRDLFDAELGKRGVRRAAFANRPIQVPNELEEIIGAIELNTRD